jgi:predicted CXXCH cytochrome family protein
MRSSAICFNRDSGSLRLLLAAALALAFSPPAFAQDPPHARAQNVNCADCHISHHLYGDQADSTFANANLCLSCHQAGGTAFKLPLANAGQAQLAGTLLTAPRPSGTSHRWDGSLSGLVTSPSGLAAGAVQLSGIYTGRYAGTYTLTITTGGSVGTAHFDWAGTAPGAGSGTNVLTGKSIPLEMGLTVSFVNFRPAPAYRVGDQWRLTVHPGLNLPGDLDLVFNMPAGQIVCSTCHDQHSQMKEPFDPAAPPYTTQTGGAGRHFMRLDNSTDQLCAQCHAGRFVTNALAGTHPVGILMSTNAGYHPPSNLPLGKSDGKLWCSTCHQVHGSPANDGSLLRAASETRLCTECHTLGGGSAAHLLAGTGPLWPGGQYGSLLPADTDPTHRGACGNCHRVHGWPDPASATNDYPHLLVEREENLCYTCHDGSPAVKNLRANFAKTYKHPVSLANRHTTAEEGVPARYGTANRHSECEDCHNPHALAGDNVPPVSPYASASLKGVPRVSVNNVNSNQVQYIFRGADDPTPAKEYEVCFTCHSGWTTQPAGQSNLAADFNEKNASFHPVEGPGKNLNINPAAFVNGWNPTRLTTCSDCHTSDDPTIRGPHGSTNQFILKRRTVASPARRATTTLMARDEQCFDCHNYDTYANNSASTTVKNYSRFSGSEGHGYHVSSRRYSCYNCHETHGSTRPNLLVTGRSPGINTYTRTANGGSCNATCHGNESYSVTYPR